MVAGRIGPSPPPDLSSVQVVGGCRLIPLSCQSGPSLRFDRGRSEGEAYSHYACQGGRRPHDGPEEVPLRILGETDHGLPEEMRASRE